MSNESPRDEWLTSALQNTDETMRADELDTFLAAALMRTDTDDISHLSDTVPLDARISNEQLAHMLVEAGEGIAPDAGFAADLQAQIESSVRARGRGRATRLRSNLRRFRPLWAAMAALLLLTFLLALPPVQANLRRSLCIGSVCIVPGGSPRPAAGLQGSVTPTPLLSVLDLAGRTTLTQARTQATFPVRLPTYPTNLGQPDYVFLQNLNGAAVVLVWVDHAHPGRVRLSVSELSSGIYVYKFATEPIAVTTVHGQQALWTTGPYIVELQDGTFDTRRLMTGHALIWTEGKITYQLETSVSLEEAVRIAESLR